MYKYRFKSSVIEDLKHTKELWKYAKGILDGGPYKNDFHDYLILWKLFHKNQARHVCFYSKKQLQYVPIQGVYIPVRHFTETITGP